MPLLDSNLPPFKTPDKARQRTRTRTRSTCSILFWAPTLSTALNTLGNRLPDGCRRVFATTICYIKRSSIRPKPTGKRRSRSGRLLSGAKRQILNIHIGEAQLQQRVVQCLHAVTASVVFGNDSRCSTCRPARSKAMSWSIRAARSSSRLCLSEWKLVRSHVAPQFRRNWVNHFKKATERDPVSLVSMSLSSLVAPSRRRRSAKLSRPQSRRRGCKGTTRSLAPVLRRLSMLPTSGADGLTMYSMPSTRRMSVTSSWQISPSRAPEKSAIRGLQKRALRGRCSPTLL